MNLLALAAAALSQRAATRPGEIAASCSSGEVCARPSFATQSNAVDRFREEVTHNARNT
jgi:hypothetical protein